MSKQLRRQSKDFNEVWNIQTSMNISTQQWNNIFHNWKNPEQCTQNKNLDGCDICNHLKKYGFIVKNNGEVSSVNVAFVSDVHSNYAELLDLIKSYKLKAIVCAGDLGLWSSIEAAKTDKKAYEHTMVDIENFIKNPVHFDIPVYVIKGNHEDFDNMYTKWFTDLNIHYVNQSEILQIHNLSIGCLGGIYSPKQINADSSKFFGRTKRFFTMSEIEELKQKKFDVLVTHQSSSQTLPERIKEGVSPLFELLKEVNPKYYIHGHHHVNYENTFNNTKIFGLGKLNKNNIIIINGLTKEIYATN